MQRWGSRQKGGVLRSHEAEGPQMVEAQEWVLKTGPTSPHSCSVLGTMASAQPDTRRFTSRKHMPGHLAQSEDGQTTLRNVFWVLGTNPFAFYPLSEGLGVSGDGTLPCKGAVIPSLQRNGEMNHSSPSPCDPFQTLKRTMWMAARLQGLAGQVPFNHHTQTCVRESRFKMSF